MLEAYCQDLREMMQNGGIRAKYDNREEPSVGRRFNEWEVKGVPLRYEVGAKEVKDRTVTLVRRDTGEKKTVDRNAVLVETEKWLKHIQTDLYNAALAFREEHTTSVSNYEDFKKTMETKRGFIKAFWCENKECEAKIKEETKATTRCLPLDAVDQQGSCVYCGKDAIHEWIFAQAY